MAPFAVVFTAAPTARFSLFTSPQSIRMAIYGPVLTGNSGAGGLFKIGAEMDGVFHGMALPGHILKLNIEPSLFDHPVEFY